MTKLAVINTGGKQYLVKQGQVLRVEKLPNDEGASLLFDAMLVANEDGTDTAVGTPTVSGAKVKATVVEHGRAKKIPVIKFKSKSRYRRNVGHRQPYTKIQIDQISAA